MIEFNTSANVHEWCLEIRDDGRKVGFVPTMGALHEGHLSLIRIAREECDTVVASIFVNPTQFNESSDYEKYPVTIEEDKAMLLAEQCDAVFVPGVYEIYPDTKEFDTDVDLGYLATRMEAARRPGHFEGVMQVVKRLLEIVEPDALYLGRKDYQQFMVISKMVETIKIPVDVIECPIIREEDGLAMSSRNRRLSKAGRQAAVHLSQALRNIKEHWRQRTPFEYSTSYFALLNEHPLIDVEYLEIVESASLRSIDDWHEAESAIAFIAAFVDDIRLIDNLTIY